jgi:hypothetical protein
MYRPKGRESLRIGKEHEYLVVVCYERCPERMPEWLLGLREASEEEDARAIDVVALTDAGDIPLQVKSSWRWAREHEKKHPDIPVIVIHTSDSEEAIRRKLKSLLRRLRKAKIHDGCDEVRRGGQPSRSFPADNGHGRRRRGQFLDIQSALRPVG